MPDSDQPNLVIVDIYGNGYDQPPTAKGIQTFLIDPSNPPTVGQKVAVLNVKDQPYSMNASGASNSSVAPAKIINVNAFSMDPVIYQVDIYANGFHTAPTQTGITAYSVDNFSVNFVVDDEVSVFQSGNKWWVCTTKPYSQITGALIFYARTTGSPSSGGHYPAKQTSDYQGPFVTGAPTITVVEATGSMYISTGTDILVTQLITGQYRTFYPLGSNS